MPLTKARTPLAIQPVIIFSAGPKVGQLANETGACAFIGKPVRMQQEAVPWLAKDEETVAAIDFALDGMKVFVPASSYFSYRKNNEIHYMPLKTTLVPL